MSAMFWGDEMRREGCGGRLEGLQKGCRCCVKFEVISGCDLGVEDLRRAPGGLLGRREGDAMHKAVS